MNQPTEHDATGHRGDGGWVNLRDNEGRIQGRINRFTGELLIIDRGKKTIHDLRRILTPCQISTDVLG